MTKKELEAARDIKKELNGLEEWLDYLRTTGGVNSSISSATVAKSGKTMEAIQTAAETEEKIKELRHQLEIEQEIIWRWLKKASLSKRERELMRLFYVECRTMSSVAVGVGYSVTNAKKIKAKILEKLIPSDTL